MKKLQKEINTIAKLNISTGELYVIVEIKATNYREIEEKSNLILSNLVTPEGFELSESLLYKKDLKVYISFKKI